MWEELLERQHGVVSRAQAGAHGITDKMIKVRLRSGYWRRLHTGVFATFGAEPSRLATIWAAVLRAGPGAAASHETAAELAGLKEPGSAGDPVHITVPEGRRVRGVRGVRLHRSARLGDARHPGRLPPQTRVEETVVDLAQSARTLEQALGWIARAVGTRTTTADRISAALCLRRKLRWRAELSAALSDVAAGCHSLLELRYLREVERAHGLPRADRQVAAGSSGRRRYDDVRYPRYRTVVELDGRAAHPEPERWRDMRRDNAAVSAGWVVLRYGYGDVTAQPCAVAGQVAQVLTAHGWRGRPRRCRRPDCMIPDTFTPDPAHNRPGS